jgi:thiamine biosynthesis lipoprotein
VPWRIDTREHLADSSKAAIGDRIDRFDRDWSRFREDSFVQRISRQPGRHRLPDDAGPLLELYRELYEATGGRVSPLVGRALESLGYDASYSLRPASSRETVPAWDDAIAWDGEYLETVTPVLLDVGAAGKGYLIDLVSGVLDDEGHAEHVIDASGDLLARGDVRMRVALEHPRDPTKAIGVVELHDGALAASASNRRAWGAGLHHVLDAVTGEPTGSVLATWALAGSAMLADGAATALFFEPSPDWVQRRDIHYVRMFASGAAELSQSYPGELFS